MSPEDVLYNMAVASLLKEAQGGFTTTGRSGGHPNVFSSSQTRRMKANPSSPLYGPKTPDFDRHMASHPNKTQSGINLKGVMDYINKLPKPSDSPTIAASPPKTVGAD